MGWQFSIGVLMVKNHRGAREMHVSVVHVGNTVNTLRACGAHDVTGTCGARRWHAGGSNGSSRNSSGSSCSISRTSSSSSSSSGGSSSCDSISYSAIFAQARCTHHCLRTCRSPLLTPSASCLLRRHQFAGYLRGGPHKTATSCTCRGQPVHPSERHP